MSADRFIARWAGDGWLVTDTTTGEAAAWATPIIEAAELCAELNAEDDGYGFDVTYCQRVAELVAGGMSEPAAIERFWDESP